MPAHLRVVAFACVAVALAALTLATIQGAALVLAEARELAQSAALLLAMDGAPVAAPEKTEPAPRG